MSCLKCQGLLIACLDRGMEDACYCINCSARWKVEPDGRVVKFDPEPKRERRSPQSFLVTLRAQISRINGDHRARKRVYMRLYMRHRRNQQACLDS